MANRFFGLAIFLFILILPVHSQDRAILAPDRDGPGYYAGDADGVCELCRPEFLAWAEAHRAKIRELMSRIERIKSGELTPGCLQQDFLTCVASFAQTLAVSDSYYSNSLFAKPQVDINGSIIDRKPPSFEAYFHVDGVEKRLTASVHMLVNLDMKVRALEIFFPDFTQPLFAKTQLEYEKTGVFELLRALSRNSCGSTDRLRLYRMIENKLKPAIHLALPSEHQKKARIHLVAGPTSYCGVKFSIHHYAVDSDFSFGTMTVINRC